MFQIKAKLIYNKKVSSKYLHLAIKAPSIAEKALPGQFVNIRLTDTAEPLLRRPFSIHRVKGRNIEILYEVLGKGTEILAQRKTGEYLDVIGPLGNGFDYGSWVMGHGSWVLVAGGIGIAPLFFLAERLIRHKTQDTRYKVTVLIGAKTKSQILCEKEFKQLGYDVKISTDDGSRGFRGKVTGLLKKILPLAISYKPLAIYACGPKPMLREITIISRRYNIPTQISLEEHMACGFGVCLGCVVNTKEGYKRVCKEGPVFDTQEIIW